MVIGEAAMSMFDYTTSDALGDGWGDYDPAAVTCDCGVLLEEDGLLAGACRECQSGVERVPARVRRRYRQAVCGDAR